MSRRLEAGLSSAGRLPQVRKEEMQETEVNEVAQAAVDSTEVVLRDAEVLAITTIGEFQEAGTRLREIVSRRKDVDDERKRLVRPIDEARARIQELFRPALDNLSQAEQLVKNRIASWTAEQRRLLALQEAAAVEAARKESDRLAARAQKEEAKGHYEKAAALSGAADNVPIAEIPAPVKAVGISTRESWKAVVVDKVALIQAVAKGDVPDEAIDVNTSFLNTMARVLKGGLKYPGVEAVREDIVSARTGLPSSGYMPRKSEG